jgi:hypothetical protein
VFGSFSNGTLMVNPAALTITANDVSRPYGATNPVFTAAFNGFVNGDTPTAVTGTPTLATTATASSPVGSYPIVPAMGTLSATNYVFSSFTNGTLTVSPAALTVTANDASRAYGATNPVFTAAFAGFVNGDTSTLITGTPDFATTATASSPAGSYPIVPGLGTLTAANYLFGSFISGTLTVQPSQAAIRNPTLRGNAFTVSISTILGSRYILEYTDSLRNSIWSESQALAGTGGSITLTDDTTAVSTRYYRVRIE